MIPDLQLGVVVLTNSYYGGEGVFEAVSQTIVDSYLGLDNYGWIDLYLESFQNQSTIADATVARSLGNCRSSKRCLDRYNKLHGYL